MSVENLQKDYIKVRVENCKKERIKVKVEKCKKKAYRGDSGEMQKDNIKVRELQKKLY